jgi:outer membrane protein OmpA-like peptidoglycan-associated protein
MYFTRSNFKNGKGIADAEKKIRLKIFSAKKGLQDWEDIVEMPFCADEYSTCHPAISADGQLMVFASDMPGGFGGMDLYLTEKVNEIWQTPKNLGPEINTDKNEIFPNLHVNGVLFFSSNGHKGRGGLDVFATHLDGTSANGLIHMPSPFNSREDDLGLVIDQSGLSGFIASARKGKKYKDDIFLLNMSENIFKHQEPEPEIIVIAEKNEELNPEMNDSLLIKDFKPLRCLEVKSRIRDKNSLKPISGATMYFTNDCGDQIHQVEADGNGYTIVCLKPLCNYTVEVTNKGYQLHTYKFFPDPEIHSTWNIFLEAEPEEVLIAAGATIILDNIYYDFNKSAIQKGAATELKELARIMKLYPSMKIQLAAHTDSRGTDSYNLELSERRAFAAKDFLVARGVPSKRISTIAKGESEIRNACSDGVPCTELQHRYNRRTEVNVLSIDEPVQIQYKNGEIN